MSDTREEVLNFAKQAKVAGRALAVLTRAQKDDALLKMAQSLIDSSATIITANEIDVLAAKAAGTSAAIIDRLTLNHERIAAVAEGLRTVAGLADPIGEVVRGYRLPNGLEVTQKRVPLGVVAMIYEARPNVTVDAAGLALKSGNAVLLRGSSSALNTNIALVQAMRAALVSSDVPEDAIALVTTPGHDAVTHLMTARGLVDVIIPRGGAGLINAVVEGSTVPVIETGVGNCHVYVDESADLHKAVEILVNAKTQRVSVCNTAETVLVHSRIADEFLPLALAALSQKDVTIHGDSAFGQACESSNTKFVAATDADWAAEYYSLDLAAKVVTSIDEAIEHIRAWSTGHTEAIVAQDTQAITKFTTSLDSAAIMVNASTRFTDGGEFGFGAEIGISTQKLHARGPMGLTELTTTTYLVVGDGHIRS